MGLFSGSSKSTTNVTTQDQRVAAADQGIAVGAGATLVQNDISDTIATAAIEGATRAATETVRTGADLVRDIQGQSLDFASDTVRSSQAIAESALESSQDTVRSNVELAGLAIENLEKNKRDPNDDTLQTLGRYGAYVAGAAILVFAIYVFRK